MKKHKAPKEQQNKTKFHVGIKKTHLFQEFYQAVVLCACLSLSFCFEADGPPDFLLLPQAQRPSLLSHAFFILVISSPLHKLTTQPHTYTDILLRCLPVLLS
jgi:hypothetical protein